MVLLVVAVALVIVAEWPRLSERFGIEGRQERRTERKRDKRTSHLRVVTSTREPKTDVDPPEQADDFAASVQRDLENLPVVDPRDDRS